MSEIIENLKSRIDLIFEELVEEKTLRIKYQRALEEIENFDICYSESANDMRDIARGVLSECD